MAHNGGIFHHSNFIGTIVDDESFAKSRKRLLWGIIVVLLVGELGLILSAKAKSPMDSQQAAGGVDRDGDNWVWDHVHCPESDQDVDQSSNLPDRYG